VVFGAAFALAANAIVTVRGFRAGWKHGSPTSARRRGAADRHRRVVEVRASVQVQLPRGQERSRSATGSSSRACASAERQGPRDDRGQRARAALRGAPALYWSEFNQGYMKKPHIERFLTHDIYISPLEMVGDDPARTALWLAKGETKQSAR
jgi:hypothetical protein